MWSWKRIGAFVLMSWLLVPMLLVFGLIWGMIGLTNYAMRGQWDDPDDNGGWA